MKNKKVNIFIIISILLLLFITIGISFAYFTATIIGAEETTTITTTGGVMNISYSGGPNINISNIYPKADAITTKNFTVTGNNTTGLDMFYNISLVVVSNTFTEDALKYKLLSTNTGGNGIIVPSIIQFTNIDNNELFLGNGSFTGPNGGAKVHTYNLVIYFPETGVNQNINQGKEFSAYIKIEEEEKIITYNKSKGVNKPVLFTGMEPVIWDGNNFVATTETDPSWYDYSNKKWANARTQDGSYWVWIPRYAYKITSGYNLTTTGTIDIKFLKGTSNETEDNTVIESTGYDATAKNTSMHYFLHPAFEFNGAELGFWVAKYQSSVSDQTHICYTKPNSTNCNLTSLIVKVIPNASIWRYINIFNMFNVTLDMKNKGDIYGWDPNEVDTHLMKNTEWGAVAYLSKSIFGADTNEVWNNSYNKYQTGCSGTSISASDESSLTYNTVNGQKASTTLNIYGVYDMSGGALESVMGNYNNLAGFNSGFTNQQIADIDSKYITRYTTPSYNLLGGTGMDYDKSVYGDAMYETSKGASRNNSSGWTGNYASGWFNDYTYLPYTTFPWIPRGSDYNLGSGAGLFEFDNSNGFTNVNGAFRPVLFSI